MRKISEECGAFGVFSKNVYEGIAETVYYGLFALQHRGQDGCGISVNNNGEFTTYKELGIVGDVFSHHKLMSLGGGNIAVGHVRYGTTGKNDRLNTHPIVVNHIQGNIALVHNGNITNAYELRKTLELAGSIFSTTSDTEVILHEIIRESLKSGSIESAVCNLMTLIEGAYSLILMTKDKLIAVRDRNGFRPLCYGVTDDGRYIVASESCALDATSAKFVRDIRPGEVVVFDNDGVHSHDEHCGTQKKRTCVFEYIYFARPDSVIDGNSVHAARLRAGEFLAKRYPVDADVVVGVPDSGITAALGYSKASGIPYGVGFIKNKYIARTFISPSQKSRENRVMIKLNIIKETVAGKRIVLVDDSIVRGTTSARIIKLLREAGAAEIHMRISAPPFVSPCYYGTDVDSFENLIAYKHTVAEIAEIIGVDSLGYLDLEDVVHLAPNSPDGFCTACFGGEYPTSVPHGGKSLFEDKK